MIVKCPKCNKLLEVPKEKLGKKEVCEHCENVFIVDESIIFEKTKSELHESPTKTVEYKFIHTKVSPPGEIVFYTDEKGVRITNTRAIFGNVTYAMNNITSVSKGIIPPNRKPWIIIAVTGFILLAIFGGVKEASGAIVGAFIMALGIIAAIMAKPKYTVRIGSASGETHALISEDERYVQNIINAINEAIVKRG